MSRPLVDRMRIVSPCNARWDEMVGTDRVRFCEHCNLSVHDASTMRRHELEALARASNGRLCLRISRGEDGRVRTLDSPPPLVPIARRRSRVAAGAMAIALVAGAAPVFAGVEGTPPAVVSRTPQSGGSSVVEGVVTDANDAVIAGAMVMLTRESAEVVATVVTDFEGQYRFLDVKEGDYTVVVEAQGFRTEQVPISVRADQQAKRDVYLESGGVSESVDVLGGSEIISPADPFVLHTDERRLGETRGVFTTPLVEAEDFVEALALTKNVDARGTFDETALMHFAYDESKIEALLRAGANPNRRDVFGATALMRAALYGDPKIAKLLLDAGADVNASDKDGFTALMAAALDDNVEVVKVLLAAGADTRARDRRGTTALDYANVQGRFEIVRLLEAAGATR